MKADRRQDAVLASQLQWAALSMQMIAVVAATALLLIEGDRVGRIPLIQTGGHVEHWSRCGPHVSIVVQPNEVKLFRGCTLISSGEGKGTIAELGAGLATIDSDLRDSVAVVAVADDVLHEELIAVLGVCMWSGFTRLSVEPML